ncbi:CBS domain-containing protein CBSX5 [Triticum urartu]|uniref:CBS domain-containing protein CBSX5 n=1 Tax=Triticum urartu TaxID=4572 RepID=M7YVH7_TRIUA|nr:CBS domain-containing protein CBSX5 [Triticum urartu]
MTSVLEALDEILSGAQVLAVPLRSGGRKKQLGGVAGVTGDFCWLTQEDLVRYFLNSISLFYHVAARSVSSLGLVRPDFLSHILCAIKTGLKAKGLDAMLELMEDETMTSFSLSSSSSDDDTGRPHLRRPSSGSFGRRSTEEPVVCSPASSLVAVMVQALAHRVSYLWVLDEEDDCRLAGIVTFADILRVFREQLQ